MVAEEVDQVAVAIISPPQSVGYDRLFEDNLQAMAYARLIRLEFGWRITDRCDGKTKLRALQRG